MKRSLILYTLVTLILGGTYTKSYAQDKFIAEQIVAVVGSSMIMLSDLESTANEIAEQRKSEGYTSDKEPMCEALETLLMQKLLANQAQLDSLEANVGSIENNIEQHVNNLIEQHGSIKALEAVYKKPIYQIKDDLKSRYVDMQLAQMMQMNIQQGVSIIPSEVEKFYRGTSKDSLPMIPEQYVYAQIILYPPSIEDAKLRTRERLLELRERIMKGDKFNILARMYSQDPGSAVRGGEMEPTPKEGFVKPFADALDKLKPGQISEVVETEFGFHVIELLERKGNLLKCRHILMRPEFTQEEILVSSRKLDSIANQIRKDSITFEKAAAQFSEDKFSKYNGGLVSNHEQVEMYQADAKATSIRFFREDLGPDYQYIRGMKVGDVSESYQTQDMKGNQMSKIIMLKEIVPSHKANIKEDYSKIEEIALANKRQKIYSEWLKKKMAAMYIKIDDRFLNCDFDNKGWIK